MIRIFVSGVWDLLHAGHLLTLEFARSLGDHLTVSVASDATVRALKREPIIGEHDRFLMVSALSCVDAAFVARGEPNHRDCFPYVANLRPAYWVIDATDPHRAEKEAWARTCGACLITKQRPVCGPSTTDIIARCTGTEHLCPKPRGGAG